MVEENLFHKSVLKQEVLEALNIQKGETYIDATVGGGGHTKGILELGGKVLAVDVDPVAVRYVANCESLRLRCKGERLYAASDELILVQGSFTNLTAIAKEFGLEKVAGILFDLGVSSHQLDSAERGFSFAKPGPLDMRMDPNLSVTAADLVNNLKERELYELFNKFSEEPASRRLARAIVESRIKRKIETTKQLAEIIERAVPRRGKIHPATRAFQALRIVVNDELNNLKKGLVEAASLLKIGGRLVVISFHSLEDQIVKNFFKHRTDLLVLTKKPIVPTRNEILENPRARSAKMRAAQKQ